MCATEVESLKDLMEPKVLGGLRDMTEKLLGVVTRAIEKGKGFLRTLYPEDVCVAFTNKRVMILKAVTTKGIIASAFGPLATAWAIKKLKEQDKLEQLPIDALEKELKYEIPLKDVTNVEVGGDMLVAVIKITTKTKTYQYNALEDKKGVEEIISAFTSLLNKPAEY
jgi:hypothetical protein